MIIGIPKEVKVDEYRVGLVPSGVKPLISSGHSVLVQKKAGEGSGIHDNEYVIEGATLVDGSERIFNESDLIIKVKEPLPHECELLQENQIIYTYLHLAALPELTETLLEKKITAIAYETVQEKDGSLPLLIPMSEVAGRMAIHEGAKYLEREEGGRGILLGGVPGVEPGKVLIIGGGIVGFNSAKMAVGTGAEVTILDKNLTRLRYIDDIFGGRIKTVMSNSHSIASAIKSADLVIGSVLTAGAKAPKLVSKELLKTMQKGSVIVDVCIDQGGCMETSKPTSHSDPVFIVNNVIHYCVANMPGALARTSTFALTNATFPYAKLLADLGVKKALENSPSLGLGVNLMSGSVTHKAVAASLSKKYTPLKNVL